MARIVYTDMTGQERSVPLGDDHPVVSIGRATDCTIRSNRKSVSRRHAEFRYASGQFEIIDLNSSNGTFLIINDERKPVLGREYLAHNDEVWCGDFILRFFEQEGAAAGPYDDPSTLNGELASPFVSNGGGYGGGAPAFGGMSNEPQMPQFGPGNTDPPPNQQSWTPGRGAGEPSFGEAESEGYSSPRYDQDISTPIDRSDEELERLRAEKDSIAELAERQKREIDELQRRLDDVDASRDDRGERTSRAALPEDIARLEQDLSAAQDDLDRFRADVPRLESELSQLQQENDRLRNDAASSSSDLERTSELESELSRLRDENRTLHDDFASLSAELARTRADADEARSQASAAAGDDGEVARLQGEVEGNLRDIATLEEEVERVSSEMRRLQREAEETTKAEGQKNREESDTLRREIERHKRLVEEFERRNRELQEEVDETNEVNQALTATVAEHEEKLNEFETEIERLAADLESARTERDAASSRVAELEAGESVEDLKNEIEGLKRRLKMEKERAGEDDARISEEVERLNLQVGELEGENAELRSALEAASSGRGASSETLADLHEKVESLDRIVDAIARTNLDPLGTVDRVRLQAAIRDTDPKATLAALLAMTEQET